MQEAEVQQLAGLLKKLEPGILPYPVFEQVARIAALPVLELVPYRYNGDVLEILLLERPADDPLWPGMLHTPGTIIRASDLHETTGDVQLAFDRLLHDELGGTAVGQQYFVGSLLHKSKRGVEQAQVYCAELLETPKVGTLFPVQQLPGQLIDSQKEFIRRTADYITSKQT